MRRGQLLTHELCYGKAVNDGGSNMETVDWENVIIGTLAIVIFVGGLFMMFTNIWKSDIGRDK